MGLTELMQVSGVTVTVVSMKAAPALINKVSRLNMFTLTVSAGPAALQTQTDSLPFNPHIGVQERGNCCEGESCRGEASTARAG